METIRSSASSPNSSESRIKNQESRMKCFCFCPWLVPRTGDVRSFNGLMTKWERVFITKGTYLLMEKCLMLVYRNLVKKM